VQTLADRKNYVELLEAVPVLSHCTKDVLEEFVRHTMVRVHCASGKQLNPLTEREQNLYLLTTGEALLTAEDGITVELEAGDYFGRSSSRRPYMVANVVAVSDIELVVINPQELDRLLLASACDRHPARIEWTIDRPTAKRRPLLRAHRRASLAGVGS
jgi:CRP-like cAMP-binding protein